MSDQQPLVRLCHLLAVAFGVAFTAYWSAVALAAEAVPPPTPPRDWVPVITAVGGAVTTALITVIPIWFKFRAEMAAVSAKVTAEIGGVKEDLRVVAGNVDGKLEKLMRAREENAYARGGADEKVASLAQVAVGAAAVKAAAEAATINAVDRTVDKVDKVVDKVVDHLETPSKGQPEPDK